MHCTLREGCLRSNPLQKENERAENDVSVVCRHSMVPGGGWSDLAPLSRRCATHPGGRSRGLHLGLAGQNVGFP